MEPMLSYNATIMFKSHFLKFISFNRLILAFFIIFFIFIITLINGGLEVLNVKSGIITIGVFMILLDSFEDQTKLFVSKSHLSWYDSCFYCCSCS